jgi:hypothetical protein
LIHLHTGKFIAGEADYGRCPGIGGHQEIVPSAIRYPHHRIGALIDF